MNDCPHGEYDAKKGRNRCALVERAIGRPWYAPPAYCKRCDRTESSLPVAKAVARLAPRTLRRETGADALKARLRALEKAAGVVALARKMSSWDGDPDYLRGEGGRFKHSGDWAERAGKEAAQAALVEAVRRGMDAESAGTVARELWPEDASS